MESLFLQSVVSDGVALPLELTITATLVEGIRLNAPKLILKMADHDNDITDSFGVTNGSELVVTYGDAGAEDGDTYIDNFIVIAPPKKSGDLLLVEALQKDVYALKQRVSTPLFFNDRSPKQIFEKLAPNKKVNVLGVNGRGTFHINAGATPSLMLEAMAKELGAAVFYMRNEFYVMSYDYMKRAGKVREFHYNNPNAKHVIFAIATPYSSNLIKRERVRNYQLWDENAGLSTSGVDTQKQTLVNVGKDRLTNMNKHILPVMTFQCVGTTLVRPSEKLGFLLHRFNEERILNESLPNEQIIVELAHHQQNYEYICQLTTGVVSE